MLQLFLAGVNYIEEVESLRLNGQWPSYVEYYKQRGENASIPAHSRSRSPIINRQLAAHIKASPIISR